MVPSGSRKAEQADTPVPRPRRRMEQEQDSITVETDLENAGTATCLARGNVRGDSPTAATSRPGDPVAR